MSKGTCEVDGCVRDAKTVGMCAMHYRRLRCTGYTDPVAARRAKALSGFLAKLGSPTETGCIEFQGYRDQDGYGHYGSGKIGPELTHRLAWFLLHGEIPDGQLVCHTCDNPPCCNPEHLFLGSNLDNVADMVAKGRVRNWRSRPDLYERCPQGHEYTPENSYRPRTPGGPPACRECTLRSNARSRARHRQAKETP